MKEEIDSYCATDYIVQQQRLYDSENRIHSRKQKNSVSEHDSHYNRPAINLSHIMKLTTKKGIIQFSKINHSDFNTGYTLEDNARALVAMCMYYKLTRDEKCLYYIEQYLGFIKRCLQSGGNFFNYVDKNNKFTAQNKTNNLDEANGMAIWALGYAVSLMGLLPYEIILRSINIIEKSLLHIGTIQSVRAMAFAIKGIYYYYGAIKSPKSFKLIKTFANRMVQMCQNESTKKWGCMESLPTRVNSILPEAMLYAWLIVGEKAYKDTAMSSFNLLLSQTNNGIEVIFNKNWLLKDNKSEHFAEHAIDVAHTIITLSLFYDVFAEDNYSQKMDTAFNWFLGKNRLHQSVYTPGSGGCYDGLEESNVSINQGAESTVSYLMARLTIEKYNLQYHE